MRRRDLLPVLLLASTLALAACGESEEDEALAAVCDARASIQSHIEELEGLQITAATDSESPEAVEVRSTVSAIAREVERMTDASDGLPEDTRQQVEAATDDFLPTLDTAVVASVNEGRKLGGLTDGLARSYEETLASIECE